MTSFTEHILSHVLSFTEHILSYVLSFTQRVTHLQNDVVLYRSQNAKNIFYHMRLLGSMGSVQHTQTSNTHKPDHSQNIFYHMRLLGSMGSVQHTQTRSFTEHILSHVLSFTEHILSHILSFTQHPSAHSKAQHSFDSIWGSAQFASCYFM